MSTWVICPSCALKHSERDDKRCPKCGAAQAETSAWAPPAADLAVAAEPVEAAQTDWSMPTPGQRIAGMAFIVNSVLSVIMGLIAPQQGPIPGGVTWVPLLIDTLIGVSLLQGKRNYVGFAIFRSAAGALVWGGIHIAQGDMVTFGMQMVISLALLLLLVGDASRARIGTAVAAFALYVLFSLLGILALTTGISPLAQALNASQVEGEPVSRYESSKYPVSLSFPSDHWSARRAELVAAEAPLADAWFVWPGKDAHVLVFAESVEGTIDFDRFQNVVLENMRKADQNVVLLSATPVSHGGRLLHARSVSNSLPLERFIGLYAGQGAIYRVYAFSSEAGFAEVEDELRSIVTSFEL